MPNLIKKSLTVSNLYPKDPLEKLTIALYHRFFSFFQGYVIQFVNIAMNRECSSSGFLKTEKTTKKVVIISVVIEQVMTTFDSFFTGDERSFMST